MSKGAGSTLAGVAMFFEVGFVIMMPLVIGIAKEAKIPFMALVIPAVAALAQAHSLLPPQPGPAILMIRRTIAAAFLPKDNTLVYVLNFLGSPIVSLFLAVLVALYVFGIRAGRTIAEASDSISKAIKGIAVVVLIIGAGGVFKEIIIFAGVGEHIAAAVKGVVLNPFILAWIITAVIRWATGQGTVSAITAAGLVAPLLGVYDIDPVFLMLACAAGSNTITMPNDAAFWLMKETFQLIWPRPSRPGVYLS